ncbi:hypothetical protein [Leucobacter sp.]
MSTSDEKGCRRPRALFAIVLVVLLGLLPVTAAEAATPKHTVIASWKNGNKTKIELRLGVYSAATGKGFGWTKIKKRHGIKKYSTVSHPTKSPYGALWKGKPKIRAEYTAFAVR